ncbi:hypothetical protein [Staphylococcus sp. IVB6240]|uniref:hypothetical protein n=1 Tax=Staphylococcus sp. IVB6240 TaxID=2989771 RepID=UPI0021D1C494|nr:hypothetical protein [Staphylococcus sp. IVB6240]UXR71071.1 hypothetical protein MUA88_07725 [Staphylococcus sp. IVB6240]
MNVNLIGYHGTSREAANLITQNKCFKKSKKEDEWLGHGVYFYELIEKAKWWSEKKKDPVVIETPITVSEEKFINFDLPSAEDELGNFIIEIQKDDAFLFSDYEMERRCQTFNMYAGTMGAQVAKATFQSTNKLHKKQFKKIGYIRTEVQICVYDTDCISYNGLKIK